MEVTCLDCSRCEYDVVVLGDKNGKLTKWKFTNDDRKMYVPLKESVMAIRCCPSESQASRAVVG